MTRSRSPIQHLVLALILLAPGCHLVLPYESGRLDSRPKADAVDAAIPLDAAIPPDAATSGEPYVKPLPDLATKNDSALQGPCAVNMKKEDIYGSQVMMLCRTPATTQCDAVKYCNTSGGWHLCTATEYLKRGGYNKPSNMLKGWLAAHVRDDSQAPHDPTDGVCTKCDSSTTYKSTTLSWTKLGLSVLATAYQRVGVIASYNQQFVGTKSSPYAYWDASPAGATLIKAAVCCK